jgi:hypothetical protein
MKRRVGLIGGIVIVGLLATARPGAAAGVDDFKLSKALPADAMIIAQGRDHAGRKFVREQMQGAPVNAAQDLHYYQHCAARNAGDQQDRRQWL